MNISISDALYQRYERNRDRLNASKVCARALEHELDALERGVGNTDQDLEVGVERLRSTQERWHHNGYQDGREWVLKAGTRREIQETAELARDRAAGARLSVSWPRSFDYSAKLSAWTAIEAGLTPGTAILTSEDLARRDTARRQADEEAYANGWLDGVSEAWTLVSKSLPA
jgi:hypothetical protein